MELLKKRDKREEEFELLAARAVKWRKVKTCRRCGTVFGFDASELTPGYGEYGSRDYFAPYIDCPSCSARHIYWGRVRYWNRWIGRYLALRAYLKQQELNEPDTSVDLPLKKPATGGFDLNPFFGPDDPLPPDHPGMPEDEPEKKDDPKGPRIVEL